MVRLLIPALALVTAICPLTRALADDAKDKAAAVTAEPATQPKIRVILPAQLGAGDPAGHFASSLAFAQRGALAHPVNARPAARPTAARPSSS